MVSTGLEICVDARISIGFILSRQVERESIGVMVRWGNKFFNWGNIITGVWLQGLFQKMKEWRFEGMAYLTCLQLCMVTWPAGSKKVIDSPKLSATTFLDKQIVYVNVVVFCTKGFFSLLCILHIFTRKIRGCKRFLYVYDSQKGSNKER